MSVRNYLLSLETLKLITITWVIDIFESCFVSAFLQTGLTSNNFLSGLHHDLNSFSLRLSDYYYKHHVPHVVPLHSKSLWQTPITWSINSKIFWLYVTRHHNTDPLYLVILIFHTFKTISPCLLPYYIYLLYSHICSHPW